MCISFELVIQLVKLSLKTDLVTWRFWEKRKANFVLNSLFVPHPSDHLTALGLVAAEG